MAVPSPISPKPFRAKLDDAYSFTTPLSGKVERLVEMFASDQLEHVLNSA